MLKACTLGLPLNGVAEDMGETSCVPGMFAHGPEFEH